MEEDGVQADSRDDRREGAKSAIPIWSFFSPVVDDSAQCKEFEAFNEVLIKTDNDKPNP